MTTADDATLRAILREHGHNPPDRGKLSAADRDLARSYVNEPADPPAGEQTPPTAPAGDYDGGVTEADFPPEDEPPALPPERKPRRVRATRGPTLRERLGGKAKPAKGRPRRARVPVDGLISRMWDGFARMAAPVSRPLAVTLALQAPVAGLILEDEVKGTVVDRVLQPAARWEQRGEKVFALVGPPVIVLAMEQAQGLPEPQRSLRLAVLQTMLIEALTMWVKISGDKMEEAAARVAASEETRQQVAAIIAQIFTVPAEAEQAEEMAAA